MAVTIPTNQIQNPQVIEAAVAGPDGANRLFTVMGQFDINSVCFRKEPVSRSRTRRSRSSSARC